MSMLWGKPHRVDPSVAHRTHRPEPVGLSMDSAMIRRRSWNITRNRRRKKKIMEHNVQPSKASTSRRSFLRKGLAVGGAGTIGAGLLSAGLLDTNFALAQGAASPAVTKGDVAILRFLSAAEI